MQVFTYYIGMLIPLLSYLSGVDILRKEGPFGKGIFGVIQNRKKLQN